MAPARPVPGLACEDSFRTAAGKTIWTRFEELMSFREAALAGKNPEGVHDMRVASRRLRAAIELFRDVFPKRQLGPLLKQVKLLADALGEVRDLDVMIGRLKADCVGRSQAETDVLNAMIEEMKRDRRAARAGLKETIDRLDEDAFARRFLVLVARETS